MSPFFFLTLATLIASIQAFSITFPTSSDYWVSCKWNTLKWTFDTNDPEIFSVAIMHSNMSLLNGNCQIANSLSTSNGTANLTTNCLEATDGYYLLFVNSSHYNFNEPRKQGEVYYTSPTFTIKPNTTVVDHGKGAKYGSVSNPTTEVTTSSTNSNTEGASSHAANPVSETMDANKKSNNGAMNLQAVWGVSVALFVVIVSLTLS